MYNLHCTMHCAVYTLHRVIGIWNIVSCVGGGLKSTKSSGNIVADANNVWCKDMNNNNVWWKYVHTARWKRREKKT